MVSTLVSFPFPLAVQLASLQTKAASPSAAPKKVQPQKEGGEKGKAGLSNDAPVHREKGGQGDSPRKRSSVLASLGRLPKRNTTISF